MKKNYFNGTFYLDSELLVPELFNDSLILEHKVFFIVSIHYEIIDSVQVLFHHFFLSFLVKKNYD